MNRKSYSTFLNKKNRNFFIFGLCIFLLNQPYFVWSVSKLQLLMFLPVILISLFYLKHVTSKDAIVIFAFTFVLLYQVGGSNLFGYLNSLIFLIFLVTKENLLVNSFNWFKKVFVISLVLSLSVYTLILFFGMSINYEMIKPLNNLKIFDYVKYPFLVSEGAISFNTFNIRFNGMFDEPGVVGSIAIVLLFADRYNLRSKQNIILFIAGIFSFSFYFILSSLFYLVVFSKNKVRVIIIAIFTIFYFTTINNRVISFLVWDRFVVEDYKLKGDNRSSERLDDLYSKLFHSDGWIWGNGSNYTTKMDLMGTSSYKMLFVNYGVIYVVVLLFGFYYLARSHIRDKKFLAVYMFLFMGMMYQRPGMLFFPGSFFLLVASIYAIKKCTSVELIPEPVTQ